MSSASNAGPADGSITHKSIAVSSMGVGDPDAAGVSCADSSATGVSSPLLHFIKAPPQSDPWHPNRADRKHLNRLLSQLDVILTAIEALGTGH
ncbi:hypothetical protein Z517_03735 [Fonsecaea pedrosoi CBS 271.37]|uniref:Uncharacterized protein n=1 Tax=Fonsecaea pedrosoi CBS 271.37 TaxID=1442368 RepID=A0A0D2H0U9_9EURO|nr:uncharacterized protein Z517_03735 [Fonsecaea pedrosoi CBS 271.37]KIW84485.1 hypothetical protein Z517_03735 [Fonsecaea pedrosoi CBS 271.37]